MLSGKCQTCWILGHYLTKMGIKTVPHPSYSRDLAPCDFWLFPKLRGCRYERIEEMKKAVTKVTDMLTQEDFHGAFEKLLERYNKCIATGGDYFEGDQSFMCVLSIKVLIRKKSAPRIYIYIYIRPVQKIILISKILDLSHTSHFCMSLIFLKIKTNLNFF